MQNFDAIVVGQGYAGLTFARLAREQGLRVANFEPKFAGGLVMSVTELDPAPGGGEPSGPELTANLAMANMSQGVESITGAVESVTRGAGNLWLVRTDVGEYVARKIIVASGARLRKLGVPGEEEFLGRGVSTCADCDGPLLQDQQTVIIGSGDSAFQEALVLTQYASKVTLIMRGAEPRARAELVERAAENQKIAVLRNALVTAILGEAGGGVTGVRLETGSSGDATIPCAGVFVFVGLEPCTEFLPAEVPRDASGAIITRKTGETDLPGLWAIGAVRSGFGGLLEHAAADARRAIEAMS